DLAAFYGIAQPPGTGFVRVDLDPSRRGGLLTQASFLAIHAHPVFTSPVLRGKFVRERLLCQTLPDPPANVNTSLPPPTAGQTTRDVLAAHRKNPACASCHQLMDPIGVGFEHFDAVGLWRDEENGAPIDDSGEVVQTTDLDGAFHGAVELSARLAQSEQVR